MITNIREKSVGENDEQMSVYMDNIRGIAIVLVVWGHIIQTMICPNNFDANVVFRVIYSFHIPLFMFISGVLVYNPNRKIDEKWLWKKVKTLVIPFISWIFITYFLRREYVNRSIIEVFKEVIASPDNAMWFLWILFLLHVITFVMYRTIDGIKFVVEKICDKSRFFLNSVNVEVLLEILFFAIFQWHILPLLAKIKILGIGMCVWYYHFYFLGFILMRLGFIQRLIKARCRFALVPAFILAALTWKRIQPHFIYMEQVEKVIGNVYWIKIFETVYNYLVPILGIFAVFSIVTIFNDKIKLILGFLGRYTLEIYAIHVFFLRIYWKQGSIILNGMIAFVVSIVISLIVSYVTNIIGISGPLFGKYRRKTNENMSIFRR